MNFPENAEVISHEFLGLADAHLELVGQPISAQAVGQTVVHGLDLGTLGDTDILRSHSEDVRGRHRVEILPRPEGIDEGLIPRDVSHDPHLDLGIVGTHEGPIPLTDDESFPNASSLLGAHGDVLQVRILARQASGRGDRLHVGGVDPAVVTNFLE